VEYLPKINDIKDLNGDVKALLIGTPDFKMNIYTHITSEKSNRLLGFLEKTVEKIRVQRREIEPNHRFVDQFMKRNVWLLFMIC